MPFPVPALRLGMLPCAALAATVQLCSAQITVEPLVGWTWESQYYKWHVATAAGQNRVDVRLASALTLGARASLPVGIGSTRFAVAYTQSRPDLEVAYDFFFSTGEMSSHSSGRVSGDARIHKLALELAYSGARLPQALEIGGGVFGRRMSAAASREPTSIRRRDYDTMGASLRTSIGSSGGRWGAPRLALEVGTARTSSRVGIDILSLFTLADPDPQWASYITATGSWRFRF